MITLKTVMVLALLAVAGALIFWPAPAKAPFEYQAAYRVHVPEGVAYGAAGEHTETHWVGGALQRIDYEGAGGSYRVYTDSSNGRVKRVRCAQSPDWACQTEIDRPKAAEEIATEKEETALVRRADAQQYRVQDKTVMGLAARCYEVPGLQITLCYDPATAVLLYQARKDGFTMEATALRAGTLPADTFEPPAKPAPLAVQAG